MFAKASSCFDKTHMTKGDLKSAINSGRWNDIGKAFGFAPVFFESHSKKKVIDWRSVPEEVINVLRTKSGDDSYFLHQQIRKAWNKSFTTGVRRVEHIGDAIVNLVCRKVAYDCSNENDHYFWYAEKLCSNRNLCTAGYPNGFEAEVEVGMEYITNGIEASILRAEEIIKRTKWFRDRELVSRGFTDRMAR